MSNIYFEALLDDLRIAMNVQKTPALRGSFLEGFGSVESSVALLPEIRSRQQRSSGVYYLLGNCWLFARPDIGDVPQIMQPTKY